MEPSLLQSCRPERPCHSPLPHVPCAQITLDSLVPSACSHYLSAPLLRPSFDWEVQPYPLGSVHTHRLPLSISRAPAPHSGPPQCPAVPFLSQRQTPGSVIVIVGISSWRATWTVGHSPLTGPFPFFPPCLQSPPFVQLIPFCLVLGVRAASAPGTEPV